MANPKTKPKKPYPSFPLTPHANGQFCKKIRGKVHFFGVWSEPQAALDRYHDVAGDLHAGRSPQKGNVATGEITVKDACNAFLTWQKDKLDVGEIGARWFEDCRSVLTEFARGVGKERIVSDLEAMDFQRHRTGLAKRLGVHALRRHITAIKSVFKYAYDMGLIEQPVRFGRGLEMPTAAQQRKAKQNSEAINGKRLFTPEEMRCLIDASDGYIKAAIFLGVNGGFGNTDVATLPRAALDLEKNLVSYARPKTGVQRVFPLWPETVVALNEFLTHRPAPKNAEVARLVFLNSRGNPLVRQIVSTDTSGLTKVTNIDKLHVCFANLLRSLGLKRPGIGFYTLRHTFRTWADEVHDQHAIFRIMGHALPGMSGVYVEEISLDRLRVVTEHVREKMFSI